MFEVKDKWDFGSFVKEMIWREEFFVVFKSDV